MILLFKTITKLLIIASCTSVTLFVIGCTSDRKQLEIADGHDDYLLTSRLKSLKVPIGLTVPPLNKLYEIPEVQIDGKLGKAISILPPNQPLPLLNNSEVNYTDNVVTLVAKNFKDYNHLWNKIIHTLHQKEYSISHTEITKDKTLITNWVSIPYDLFIPQNYRGRYQIILLSKNNELTLIVKLLELKKGTNRESDKQIIRKCATAFFNYLLTNIIKQENISDTPQEKIRLSTLKVQRADDDNGLPILIMRGTYDKLWEVLPKILKQMNMKIKEKDRIHGVLSVVYKNMAQEADNNIKSGEYKLQVGDLGNRISLQFLDSNEQPLNDEQTDALIPVIQNSLNKIQLNE